MEDLRTLQNLTTEQKDLLNRFYSQFNFASAGSGLNRHIANVQELVYEGGSALGDFQVYAATKMYVCFDMMFSHSNPATAGAAQILIYDENNVVNLYSQNQCIAYDSVTPAIFYAKNDSHLKNLWFSCFTDALYNYVKFIGYRITLD